MEAFREKFLKVVVPQPMEVWLVEDEEIKMHKKDREPKDPRPVLILCKDDLCVTEFSILPVIPFSRTGVPDAVTIPVNDSYEETFDGWKPDKGSLAIVPLYQPIRKGCFTKLVGKFKADHYQAVLSTLCNEVIGFSDFDLDLSG